MAAELLVGGVDRQPDDRPGRDGPRRSSVRNSDLVAAKARLIAASEDVPEASHGRLAAELIEQSRNLSNIESSASKVLYADEYRVRAEALADARRLVGGIDIEQVGTDLNRLES